MPIGNCHIVTVLLQDYFHRGVFKQVIGEKQWTRFGSRLDKDVEDTLDLFREFEIKATFFTLGWIADNYPEIIKKIVSEGHEIGSAGYLARSVHEMTREQFVEDIDRAKNALEGAGSNKILGYRCAYKWIKKSDRWVLDILADKGYVYDASLQPPLYSFTKKHNQLFNHEIETTNGKIWEFPASTSSLFGFNFAIAGGNYLRQFPHSLALYSFKTWCKATVNPFIMYFHPWELDTELPLISAVNTISRIRQYRNLGKMRMILPDYFKEGHFQSISQYLNIPLIYPNTQVAAPIDKTGFPENYIKGEPETKPKPPKKEVSIVIPCFNEASSIHYLSKALGELIIGLRQNYAPKFIFVDDCSTDSTYAYLVERFGRREDCKIIQHNENKGVAAALQTGQQSADTDIVCSIDADCSYDPLELTKMLEALEEGIDMVVASPYHQDGFVIGVPWWRLLLSKSLSKIYHIILHHKLATYTSCFRVYRRSSILNQPTKYGDYRGIVEMVAKLDISGGKIREFPTTLQSRIFGYSKMKIFQTVFGHLKLLVWIVKRRISSAELSSQMKICVLVWSIYETDSRVRKYSEALAERGDLVDVICLSPNYRKNFPTKYNINGVNVCEVSKRLQERNIFHYLTSLIQFFIKSFYYTSKFYLRKRYDLIHVHSLPDFEVFAAIIPKVFGAKIILDIHDPVPDFFKAKFRTGKNNIYIKILSLFEWLSTKFSDHVITVTDYWKYAISKRSHIPDDKISVILNLPDTKLFNHEKYSGNKSSQHFTLLYPGTLNKHCGIDIAIKAVNFVKKKIPSIRFIIYGRGSELKRLYLMVRDLGLEDIIFFYDSVPLQKIPEIISEADVGIALLAGYDIFSQQALNVKLFEFLAMGLPSIASKTKSIEYYFDEKVVELSEPNNYKDVARCLTNLYYNSSRRDELKRNGLNYISRNNWNGKKSEYYSIIDKLVS